MAVNVKIEIAASRGFGKNGLEFSSNSGIENLDSSDSLVTATAESLIYGNGPVSVLEVLQHGLFAIEPVTRILFAWQT